MRAGRLMGHLKRPTGKELQACAAQDHIQLTETEANDIVPIIGLLIDLLDEVEELPELAPDLKYPNRDPGRPPAPEEDPYNVFIRVLNVRGASTGRLAGKRIGVKDNMAVAGVPMTNGSRKASFTPHYDAVVVERILDAGGVITGKLNLDDGSAGAFGESSVYGPPLNPRKPSYSPGGSSGGVGAAVASGTVDIGLGVDEGGSARIPAAFCGCVCIKATHGLVPSFGITYFDHTMDSICPTGSNVDDVATLLAAIAGHDWRDPQWVRGEIKTQPYPDAKSAGVEGMRVGIVRETVDSPLCQPAVVDGVKRAAEYLADSGATVEDTSIPVFDHTAAIWIAALLAGTPNMLRSDGLGYNHLGYVDVERVHHDGISRQQEATHGSIFLNIVLIANKFILNNYGHAVFARAHNQRLAFRQQVDGTLDHYDLLLTATAPITAPQLARDRLTLANQVERLPSAGVYFPFTQALNLTGHPALVLPSGLDEAGLPTSVQLVARHFQDFDAFRAGYVIEQALLASPNRIDPIVSPTAPAHD